MSNITEINLKNIWHELEQSINQVSSINKRIYRRFESEIDNGIRVGISTPGNIRELLIELPDGEMQSLIDPKWAGMKFEIIKIEVYKKPIQHLRLFMPNNEHSDIFIFVCVDIIEALTKVLKASQRIAALSNCLGKWSRFFKKYGFDGLSAENCRGLFGELFWIKRMISAGMNQIEAIKSWKGCTGALHDFAYANSVLEVKTTATKEPRAIKVSSERQLDDRGYDKLNLFVLSLQVSAAGDSSLSKIVRDVMALLVDNNIALHQFESQLNEAGYIEAHEGFYNERYIIKREELFQVRDGFPRIIDLPIGTGDLSYSVTLSSCSDYLLEADEFLTNLVAGEDNGGLS